MQEGVLWYRTLLRLASLADACCHGEQVLIPCGNFTPRGQKR